MSLDYLKKKKPSLFVDTRYDEGNDIDIWEEENVAVLPDINIDRKETVRLIAEILMTLPDDQRICLQLMYWNNMTVSQIAKTLEVSEGTVKSRLKYGRNKVEQKVNELKKEDTYLCGIAPLALLRWVFDKECEYTDLTETLANQNAPTIAEITVKNSHGSKGRGNLDIYPKATNKPIRNASKTAINPAVSATVCNVTKSALDGIMAKILAGIVIASVVAGVSLYVLPQIHKDKITDSTGDKNVTELQKENTDVIKIYEDFLSKGVTDDETEINYYTYIDLNNDNISELFVSDKYANENTMVDKAELYQIVDGELKYIFDTGSFYSKFYFVNDEYICGQYRYGIMCSNINDQALSTVYDEKSITFEDKPEIIVNSIGEIKFNINTYYGVQNISDIIDNSVSWKFVMDPHIFSFKFYDDGTCIFAKGSEIYNKYTDSIDEVYDEYQYKNYILKNNILTIYYGAENGEDISFEFVESENDESFWIQVSAVGFLADIDSKNNGFALLKSNTDLEALSSQ